MKQKIFIKGKKYISNLKNDKVIILCTKTTCDLSTNEFKGVILEILTPNNSVRSVGNYSKWKCEYFEEYK